MQAAIANVNRLLLRQAAMFFCCLTRAAFQSLAQKSAARILPTHGHLWRGSEQKNLDGHSSHRPEDRLRLLYF